jgi:hypothetical protein
MDSKWLKEKRNWGAGIKAGKQELVRGRVTSNSPWWYWKSIIGSCCS